MEKTNEQKDNYLTLLSSLLLQQTPLSALLTRIYIYISTFDPSTNSFTHQNMSKQIRQVTSLIIIRLSQATFFSFLENRSRYSQHFPIISITSETIIHHQIKYVILYPISLSYLIAFLSLEISSSCCSVTKPQDYEYIPYQPKPSSSSLHNDYVSFGVVVVVVISHVYVSLL